MSGTVGELWSPSAVRVEFFKPKREEITAAVNNFNDPKSIFSTILNVFGRGKRR
jgi:hypothetical protein